MELDLSQSLGDILEEDPEISSSPSSTEMRFLEQVKECQHHLYCMEKLFFSLQNISEGGKETGKNPFLSNQTSDTHSDSRLKRDKINFEQLIEESEEAIKAQQGDAVKPLEKLLINVQIRTENFEEIFDPMTFLIQIPSDVLNSLKSNSSIKHTSLQHSIRRIFRFRKKKQSFSLFHKIFRKKKIVVRTSEQMENSDENQYSDSVEKMSDKEGSDCIYDLNPSYQNFESPGKAQNYNDRIIHNCSNSSKMNEDIALKTQHQTEKSTYIFPMTYNFDKEVEKSCLTIHHEITQKSDSNACSHSVNVTAHTQLKNESCVAHERALNHTDGEKSSKKGKVYSEKVTEYLIEALSKATECLNDLVVVRSLSVGKGAHRETIGNISKGNQELVDSHESHQSLTRMNKSWFHSKLKYSARNEQQIPKRQSSKISVCSSLHSVTSDGEIYDKPISPKPRCHSPSRLKYLVCQSERDIVHDKRVVNK